MFLFSGEGGKQGGKGKKKSGNWTPPSFDERLQNEFSVIEGESVSFLCVVNKLRGRSVSLI